MFTYDNQVDANEEELADILGVDIDDESEKESINADPGPTKDQAVAGMKEMERFKKSLPAWPPGWID